MLAHLLINFKEGCFFKYLNEVGGGRADVHV